jgi:hypothetical protein
MHGAERRSLTPRTPVPSSTTQSTSTSIPLGTGNAATRKPQRRAERMSPMENNDNVRVSFSASFWAADLHRRVCEWEVRLSTVKCRNMLTFLVCLDVTPTRPLTPHSSITITITVPCLILCRYRRMAMHMASLRTRRTAAARLSQVSALLNSSKVSLPLDAVPSFSIVLPLIPSAPCSWSQILYR